MIYSLPAYHPDRQAQIAHDARAVPRLAGAQLAYRDALN
jgi:hypothetical protein